MMRHAVASATVVLALAGAAGAKPALRDVRQIDDGLFVIGLAHEIHKKCPTISARLLKGIGALQSLKQEARDLGYSNAEIRDHVESKSEKKRLRARAADYMKDRGLGQTDADYCALGQDEIARQSEIGALLRATQ